MSNLPVFPFLNSFQAKNRFSKLTIFSKILMPLIPPPQHVDVPLIHAMCNFYKKIYLFKPKISKRDQFGIYLKIENACLEAICLIIIAAFESKLEKMPSLCKARINIELLKRLIRISHELNLIPFNTHLEFQTDLQEISKMTNGWIKYLTAAQ